MNPSSLAYWFPKVEAAGLPVPRTILIPWDESKGDLINLLDGKTPEGFDGLVRRLATAGDQLGWPAFLRTGYGSGKHDWERTCFVPGANRLPAHVCALVEWSVLVDFVGLPLDTWVVRELLPTRAAFTAFDGLPITKERRWWTQGLSVTGHHPYWPPDSISYGASRNDWPELLADLNHETTDEVAHLWSMTEKVIRAMDGEGAWSVDWLHTDRGWVLIDMAKASESFCWEDYDTAPSTAERQWIP